MDTFDKLTLALLGTALLFVLAAIGYTAYMWGDISEKDQGEILIIGGTGLLVGLLIGLIPRR